MYTILQNRSLKGPDGVPVVGNVVIGIDPASWSPGSRLMDLEFFSSRGEVRIPKRLSRARSATSTTEVAETGWIEWYWVGGIANGQVNVRRSDLMILRTTTTSYVLNLLSHSISRPTQ
jgi:hypothetical protein